MSPDSSRRQFLVAAAAAATLPVVDTSEGGTSSEADDLGARSERVGSIEGLWSNAELGRAIDEEPSISVTGYWLDDEPSSVELTIDQSGVLLTLELSPDGARDFAHKLEAAADAADGLGD